MFTLVIGNKCYSSWSLRPWLVMRQLGIPFDEVLIPLHEPDTKARILAYSPAGKVPVLKDGSLTVWESLAIVEYLAEARPDLAVWPRDKGARAMARSIAAEMHAGFQALRSACPMNLGKRFAARERGEAVARDAAHIAALWRAARRCFGERSDGPFLFGAFSAADAMYAPVVTRFDTYGVAVDADLRAYMDAVLATAAFQAWRDAALAEPWVLAHDEVDETPVAVYRQSA